MTPKEKEELEKELEALHVLLELARETARAAWRAVVEAAKILRAPKSPR